MKLLNEEIKKAFENYPLYSQDGKGYEAHVICKFFAPVGGFTWYVTEADKLPDGDYKFFGLVTSDHYEYEFGYFLLSELESIELPHFLTIERDIYFESCTLTEAISKYKS